MNGKQLSYAKMEACFKEAKARTDSPDKWCKNAAYNGEAACTIGAMIHGYRIALNLSIGGIDESFENGCLNEVFRKANDVPNDLLVQVWNDAPQRTFSEIVQAFDKCIAYCQVHREKIPFNIHTEIAKYFQLPEQK